MTAPRLSAAGATDVGRVRAHNEDRYLAEAPVFAVADGMGGHAAGEVASAIAVDTLRELTELTERSELTSEQVAEAIGEAHSRIVRSAREHREQAGMGTTLTGIAAVVEDGSSRWAVFNVGDSRVYRWSGGTLTQVTVDHSEVQELVDAGLLTPHEAAIHPLRNIVTRSLGAPGELVVDLWVLEPQAGERFLVCSDGLSGELDDDELSALLGEGDDPAGVVQALVAAAVDHGGRDNVTVVVVMVDGVADRPS